MERLGPFLNGEGEPQLRRGGAVETRLREADLCQRPPEGLVPVQHRVHVGIEHTRIKGIPHLCVQK